VTGLFIPGSWLEKKKPTLETTFKHKPHHCHKRVEAIQKALLDPLNKTWQPLQLLISMLLDDLYYICIMTETADKQHITANAVGLN